MACTHTHTHLQLAPISCSAVGPAKGIGAWVAPSVALNSMISQAWVPTRQRVRSGERQTDRMGGIFMGSYLCVIVFVWVGGCVDRYMDRWVDRWVYDGWIDESMMDG